MYNLFSDKIGNFKCKLDLTGASLKDTKAKLIFETDEFSIFFKGEIDDSGECNVYIPKMKNIIGESCEGRVLLEVIAEDSYFMPWDDKFVIEPSKKLAVEIKSALNQNSDKQEVSEKKSDKSNTLNKDSVKPTLLVIEQQNVVDEEYHMNILLESFKENGVDKKSLVGGGIATFARNLNEYCNKMKIPNKKKFIKTVANKLSE